MAAIAKLGSFKYNFQEKRERLLSTQKGYSELGFVHIEEQEPYGSPRCCTFRSVSDRIVSWCRTVQNVSNRAIRMGQSDPRKIIFAAKMGLALMIISLLIFLKEPFKQLSRYSVWAILTVVVVFEFSIGNCIFLFGSVHFDFGFILVISSPGCSSVCTCAYAFGRLWVEIVVSCFVAFYFFFLGAKLGVFVFRFNFCLLLLLALVVHMKRNQLSRSVCYKVERLTV